MGFTALAVMVALSGAPEMATGTIRCETRTERPPSEIIVPLGDEQEPELPAQAVKIVPGERLCITGDLDQQGALINLRLERSAAGRDGPVIELVLERDEALNLWIRHGAKKWLYYRAFRLLTQQDLAAPARTVPVAPGLRGLERWNDDTRKLLLFGFRFADPPPLRGEAIVEDFGQRDTTRTNASVTVGFWGGERGIDFGELNDALARDGFNLLPYSATIGGADIDFTFGRVRFGLSIGTGGRTVQHRATGAELSAGSPEFGFTLGFDVFRYEQFHAFVSSGIIGHNLFVDRAAGLTLFPDVQPWEGDRVAFSTSMLPLEIGTDYFVPFGRASPNERFIFQLGTRVGWLEQLASGGWETDEDDPRDLQGPSLDLSGPRWRLVLGIGVQNGW